MRKVIVWGGNHHNTLGVIRSLGKVGIMPFVILRHNGKTKPFVGYSKYISKLYLIENNNEGLDLLLSQFGNEVKKPIIISCGDKTSSILDVNYNILSQKFITPGIKKQGALNELMDKINMIGVAKNVGLEIPHTAIIEDGNIPSKIKYPCITKPLASINGSKNNIKICHSADELVNAICGAPPLMVQEYIEKTGEFQLIGCSLDNGNIVIIPGVSKIIRSSSTTNTGFLTYGPIESIHIPIVEQCKKFMKHIGYSGLFSMEFLVGGDNQIYYLETNFRNDGNAYSVYASGVNLPYIWYYYNSEGSLPQGITLDVQKTKLIMPEFDDFTCFAKKIGYFTWIKDACKTDKFLVWDLKDPKPFLKKIANYFSC